MRALKFLVGLLLVPVNLVVVSATFRLLAGFDPQTSGWHPLSLRWLTAGFLLWLFIFITMPRPMRTYVLGHELTHAVWALLMGARVSRLRVSARGGSVTVSKSNWVITLAPYFFPFYTMIVFALAVGLGWFYDLRPYEPLFLGLIGLTYSFHVTFTLAMLAHHQPDIHEHGRVFSYSVILLLNVLGIAYWVIAVTPSTLAGYADLLHRDGLLLGAWFDPIRERIQLTIKDFFQSL